MSSVFMNIHNDVILNWKFAYDVMLSMCQSH